MQTTINKQDQAKFSEALTVLALALGAEFEAQRMRVYSQLLLAEYPIDVLEAACRGFARELGRKFFPTVPEFHQAILGDPESKASQGLACLERSMSEVGAYRSIKFQDPALQIAVAQAGGWLSCIDANRNLDDQAYGYWQHTFKKNYLQAMKSRAVPADSYFAGLFELNNQTLALEAGRILHEPKVSTVSLEGKTVEMPLASLNPASRLVEANQKLLAGRI